MTPLVSVIIPTYNRAQYIVEALESVFSQTYQNFEIIVVDDGSTDGTEEVLSPYNGRIGYFYQKNQGVSAARNLGIQNASGEYIAFLDSDDFWLPEMLEVQVGYLEAHPEVGMVHADLLTLEEGSSDPGPRKRIHSSLKPSGYIFPELFVENMILTTSVVVRRSCLDAVGTFDVEFHSVEDYHLWLRIARRFPIFYMHRPLGVYRVHADNITKNRINLSRSSPVVREKLLQLHPEIKDELGSNIIRRGLFNKYFSLGYGLFDQSDHQAARPFLLRAIQLRPNYLPAYGYYLACLLPQPWIKGLRRLKRNG